MKDASSGSRSFEAHLERVFLGSGLVLAIPALWVLFRDPTQFERSYLVAFLFVLAIAGGALGLVMLHRLTGGAWGDCLADILSASARTLPFVGLLFIPILFDLEALYPWARPDWAATGSSLHQLAYYSKPFFFARALSYLLLWGGFAWWGTRAARGRAALGAVGLIAYVLTMSLAGIDWGMSVGPDWASSIYGLIIVLGQALSALTFAILARYVLDRGGRDSALLPDQAHDLGSLLFAFVLTWAYLGFSQFLIIWSANLPEEVSWYVGRLALGWKELITVIVLAHFFVPFLLLLMRRIKRKPAYLALVAALLLGARLPEIIWMVVPGFQPESFDLHWMDLVLPLALGCLWVAVFLHLLRKGSTAPPVAEEAEALVATP